MYIESLALQNFQCFGSQRTVINLDPGLTPFIGLNGAGKTATCQALRRLFGISADDRTVRAHDFHVPAAESEAPRSRELVIEATLAFPELDDADDEDDSDATGAVPEFFHRMAADDHGILKCRIVLEATWEDDGTLDGGVSWNLWTVRTFNAKYGEDDRTAMPGAERARIQVIYVPASRDGARQVPNRDAQANGSSQATDEVRRDAAQINWTFIAELVVSHALYWLVRRGDRDWTDVIPLAWDLRDDAVRAVTGRALGDAANPCEFLMRRPLALDKRTLFAATAMLTSEGF
jgi:predicted ATP-dependent endonuclease of OLD family